MDAQSEAQIREICHEWDRETISRGIRYFHEQRVSKVRTIPDEDSDFCLTATVRGSRSYKVKLYVDLEDSGVRIDSHCTCPVEYECKHGVAALAATLRLSLIPSLLAVAQPQRVSSQRPSVRRPIPQPVEPLLDGTTMQWLARTQQSARPVEEPVQRLALVLSVSTDSRPPHMEVQFRVATRLKNGNWGKSKNYVPQDASYGDVVRAFPPPEDRRLLQQLGASGYYQHTARIQDGDLIRRMIETDRCFWDKDTTSPLRLGPPRQAHPVWALMKNGVQEPAWQIQGGGRSLPVWPMWYVDTVTSEAGPLTVDIAEAVADSWWRAPAIPPDLAPRINATGAFAAAGLPAPVEIPVETLDLKPVPVLRLSSSELLMSSYGDRLGYQRYAVNLAHVDFLYGSWRVPETSQEGQMQWFEDRPEGGRVVKVGRRLRAESKLREMLDAWSFTPATGLPVYESGRDDLEDAGTFENPDDWIPFILEGVPRLKEQGWTIEMDDSFTCRVAKVDEWFSEVTPASGDPNQWFEFSLGVQVGDERINLLPVLNQLLPALEDLNKNKGAALFPVRLPDGRVIALDRARAKAIATTLIELFDPQSLNAGGKLEISRLRAAQLSDIGGPDTFQWRGSSDLTDLGQRLKTFDKISDIAPPPGLNATLREYQLSGLAWLQFLREFDLAGILADDMGLGKTVEALAHLMVEKQSGRADRPSLVIAPTSLMSNWRREAERFTPSLKVLISHGTARKEQFDNFNQYDLIVTSYALLPRDKEILLPLDYHMAILDEAQYIKNPRTIYADVARQLKARHRLCLTGTPMENHLGELWSIMHFLMPGFLSDEKRFKRIFRDPIEKQNDTVRRAELVRRIKPFVLRRRKEDVAKELPEKTQILRTVELAGAQRDLYETIRLAMHEKVQNEIAGKGLARSHIIILEALLKLRQVCCDPRLVKLTMAGKVKESAKLEMLMDMVPEMLTEGRRILLFSQFTSMLELIEIELNKLKIPFVKLTGETRDRESPVRAFQSNNVPLFLISLKAGGTGLNLTAADTVIHYDPWWNPAVENQATDRAHRIGQDKKVFVYKLVTQGTVEERILAMQDRKRALVQGVLGEGAGANLALTANDLKMLFEPVK